MWATAPVLRYITDRGLVDARAVLCEVVPGEESLVEGMRVLAFPTMHDQRGLRRVPGVHARRPP